jgi:hypothetical protein
VKRPSYLQQAAATPTRRGIAVLSPPRLVFAPAGAAAEFVVREARHPAAASGPGRTVRELGPAATELVQRLRQEPYAAAAVPSAMPGQAPPLPAARSMAPPSPSPALFEDRRPAGAPDREMPGAATRFTPGTTAAPAASPLPGMTMPVRKAAAPAPQMAGLAPRDVAAAPSARSVAPPPAGMPAGMLKRTPETTSAGIAMTDPPLSARPRAGSEVRPTLIAVRTVPSPAAAPRRASTTADLPLAAAAPRGAEAAPPVRTHAAPPVLAPPAPPPRAPVPHAARDHTPSGLHIGTLEVRVTPPPAPQAAPFRPAPRQVATRAGGGRAAPIARGFGVFGLAQS